MAHDDDDCSWCNSPDHVRPDITPLTGRGPSRRDFLYVGLVGGLGLTLGNYLGLTLNSIARGEIKNYASKEGKAKSVIHIFLPGGMSAQESFDPKPFAPIEYRGPFSTIKTRLEGEIFSETIPKIAGIADKITVVRSMTHGEAAHERGVHNMFTGYRPSPAVQYPSMGSVVSHEFGPRNNLPPYVAIPSVANEFAGSGYLSSAYGPFSLGADPANKAFKVRDLNLAKGIDDARFERRKTMLQAVDNHFRTLEKSDALDAMDSFYQRAYNLISSKQAREAFDVDAEPDAIKEEYGRNPAGMRMLMSRRLVEAGVRFVSMTFGSWDHHANLVGGFKNQMPRFDQALATLIIDLERRGLLDSTLVMVTSEFGRTPKINKDNGRDHWPRVFSIVLAGGGIKKGQIYGSSDATASEPNTDPLTVEDMATTIYNQLGIVADKELMAPGGRPIEIVDGGRVVEELLV
ncbi:MAG TPA: DUF1501 domain-containing protein [Tepidisphaeraceae bacterium]|nr:DUF1501 domain-containing protein [Tepidisphaeraceae bacterium]